MQAATNPDRWPDQRAACERVLGPDDQLTLKSASGLARAYVGVGRRRKAVAMYREILAGYQRTLGPNNPITREIHE